MCRWLLRGAAKKCINRPEQNRVLMRTEGVDLLEAAKSLSAYLRRVSVKQFERGKVKEVIRNGRP